MKSVLITGANKGLGFETAHRLKAEGQTVYLGARNAERGRKAADELGVNFVQPDVTSEASVAEAATEIERREGRLDVLVNNAGIREPNLPVDDEGIPLYSATKAAATMLTVQYAKMLPHMRVNAADPGYTKTDFNGGDGAYTVAEGAEVIVQLATLGADGSTGTLVDHKGTAAW